MKKLHNLIEGLFDVEDIVNDEIASWNLDWVSNQKLKEKLLKNFSTDVDLRGLEKDRIELSELPYVKMALEAFSHFKELNQDFKKAVRVLENADKYAIKVRERFEKINQFKPVIEIIERFADQKGFKFIIDDARFELHLRPRLTFVMAMYESSTEFEKQFQDIQLEVEKLKKYSNVKLISDQDTDYIMLIVS